MQKYILLLLMGLSVASAYGQAFDFSSTVKIGSSLSVSASGGVALSSYEWLMNDKVLTETGPTLKSNFNEPGVYVIKVREHAASGCVGGYTIGQITVEEPVIDFSGKLQLGTSVKLTAMGNSQSTYEWRLNGQLLTETSAVLTYLGSKLGKFYLSVQEHTKDGCLGLLTNGFLLVEDQPEVLQPSAPADQQVCPSSAAHFSTQASSASPLRYEWQQSADQGQNWMPLVDNASIQGSATADLWVKTSLGMAGQEFRCQVSNSSSTVTTSVAHLSMKAATEITQMPLSFTKNVGESVQFQVTAKGEGSLSYQWFKDGAAFGASTTEMLKIDHVLASDAGLYTVRVSAACGAQTTSAAKLVVHIPARITEQPSNQEVCKDSKASFEIKGEGEQTLSYRWEENKAGNWVVITESTAYTGTSSSILTVAASAGMNGYQYRCTLTNIYGSETSSSATLVLKKETSISQQPVPLTLAVGRAASFSITADGSGVLQYQWSKNGVPIPNSNSSVLNIPITKLEDAGTYTASAIGACGTAISAEASLQVGYPPAFALQPADALVCSGDRAIFSVSATGDPSIAYHWQVYGDDWTNLSDNDQYSGTESNRLVLKTSDLVDAWKYRCVLSSPFGTATSNAASVKLKNIKITQEARSAEKRLGDAYQLAIGAVGGGELSYQWLLGGKPVQAANQASLNFDHLRKADEGSYVCVVSNDCGSVSSQAVSIIVGRPAIIQAQPQAREVCVGTEAKFSLTADVDGSAAIGLSPSESLLYRWQIKQENDFIDLQENGTYTGVSSSNLTIKMQADLEGKNYRCVVSNAYGTVESDAANLQLKTAPVFLAIMADVSACPNTQVTWSVAANETAPIAYKWQEMSTGVWADLQDDKSHAGSASQEMKLQTAIGMDGWKYRAIAHNECGDLASNSAILSLIEETSISKDPLAAIVRVGERLKLRIEAKGAHLTYHWKKGGNLLTEGASASGVLSSELTINSLQLSDAGLYSCLVTGDCGSKESAMAKVMVGYAPTFASHPQNIVICSGNEASFTVNADGSETMEYQWRVKGSEGWTVIGDDATYSGTASSQLLVKTKDGLDGQIYECVASNLYGRAESVSAQLFVKQHIAPSQVPLDAIAHTGDQVQFGIQSKGSDLQFQWYKGSVLSPKEKIILGANSSQLNLGKVVDEDKGYYAVVVTGYCESKLYVAELKIPALPKIIDQPHDASVCDGRLAAFSISAAENETLAYQWMESHDNGQTFHPLSDGDIYQGSRSKALGIRASGAMDTRRYYCQLTGFAGTISSDLAQLKIEAPAKITQDPHDISGDYQASANFSVQNTGTLVHYQWYKGQQILQNSDRIKGADAANLVIGQLSFDDQGAYTCKLIGDCGEIMSHAAYLKINKLPQTIRFDALKNKNFGDADFEPHAVASSGLAITYRSDNPQVAVVVGNSLHIKRAGVVNIIASQIGNGVYEPAKEVSQQLAVLPVLPKVETDQVNEITESTATAHASIISDGGSDILERGICWSTNPKPSIMDRLAAATSSDQYFDGNMSNLEANSLYYIRSYCRNELVVVYGNEISFKTLPPIINEQAHDIHFSRVDLTSFDVSWKRGNGSQCAVFIKETEGGNADPVDGQKYMANSVYGQGDQIGSTGWFCVFNGNGTNVDITGLNPAKTYTLMVCEYNGSEGNEHYLRTLATGNPASKTTSKREPFIYTFFSPNNDGRNDYWLIENADLLKNSEVKVFSPNNQEVYSSIGYPEAWDGKKNGQSLPVGEYYYLITGEYQLKGVLVIMHQ